MKVVIDTNVLLAAVIKPFNPPQQIYEAWKDGRFELYISEAQLEEIRRVSRYEKMRAILPPFKVGAMINSLKRLARIVSVGDICSEPSKDPDDDFLIAICEASDANALVTGDKRAGLLQRRHIGVTEIMTARQFVEKYLD